MDDQQSVSENKTSQEAIQRIGESALAELGLDKLPDEDKADFLVQLAEIVQARMSSRVIDQLSDDELESFNKTLDEKGDEAASDYVLELFPNYEMMVMEEYRKLVNEIHAQQGEVLDILEARQKERAASDEAGSTQKQAPIGADTIERTPTVQTDVGPTDEQDAKDGKDGNGAGVVPNSPISS